MNHCIDNRFYLCRVCHTQNSARIRRLFTRALEYEHKGDPEQAVKAEKKLFNPDLTNPPSVNSIAGLYGKTGRFAEEIYKSCKATRINPAFQSGFFNLGVY